MLFVKSHIEFALTKIRKSALQYHPDPIFLREYIYIMGALGKIRQVRKF
jgi:hypothetical protein